MVGIQQNLVFHKILLSTSVILLRSLVCIILESSTIPVKKMQKITYLIQTPSMLVKFDGS